jgi:hypothetical protein
MATTPATSSMTPRVATTASTSMDRPGAIATAKPRGINAPINGDETAATIAPESATAPT